MTREHVFPVSLGALVGLRNVCVLPGSLAPHRQGRERGLAPPSAGLEAERAAVCFVCSGRVWKHSTVQIDFEIRAVWSKDGNLRPAVLSV